MNTPTDNNQAKIIAVANRKGGVGKTTNASHIASGLAILNYRVCLVGVDPQGHENVVFGLPVPDKRNPNDFALFHLMTDKRVTFTETLRQVPPIRYQSPGWNMPPNLTVLPSNALTTNIPITVPNPARFRRRMRELIDLMELDFIIVDTNPTNTLFDGAVMMAADSYLYVTEASTLSFDGLSHALSELETYNEDLEGLRDRPIELLGILPNRVRGNTNNHKDNLKKLVERFGKRVLTPVMQRTVLEEQVNYGQMAYSYVPYGAEARMMMQLTQSVLRATGDLPEDSNIPMQLFDLFRRLPAPEGSSIAKDIVDYAMVNLQLPAESLILQEIERYNTKQEEIAALAAQAQEATNNYEENTHA